MPRAAPALLLLAALVLAGCPEVTRGPRLVNYNPDWFYVRHAPWIDGDAAVADLAAAECRRVAASPLLTDELALYPFDLRYAVYRCVGGGGVPHPMDDPGTGATAAPPAE